MASWTHLSYAARHTLMRSRSLEAAVLRTLDHHLAVRYVAVDWSGAASIRTPKIWSAMVGDSGALVALRNRWTREDVVDWLIELLQADSAIIVGLDFAFSMPAWFVSSAGCVSALDFWDVVATEGERWLDECPFPFWGRTAHPKKWDFGGRAELRNTDLGGAKSVFQVFGAGAVGTASIRGMPYLRTLRAGGYHVWPFDPLTPPAVIEIYPRLLTKEVHKSQFAARQIYLAGESWLDTDDQRNEGASSEDAFDALVSARRMWESRQELDESASEGVESDHIEGRIWNPDPNRVKHAIAEERHWPA